MISSSPSKTNHLASGSVFDPTIGVSTQQRFGRSLRKLKSAHNLTSSPSRSHQLPSMAQLRQHQQQHQSQQYPPPHQSAVAATHREPLAVITTPSLPASSAQVVRTRSNSDAAGVSVEPSAPRNHAVVTKKLVTPGSHARRDMTLDALVREGPRNGNVEEGLDCIRYQVLSNGVGSDHDGMVRGWIRGPMSSQLGEGAKTFST